MTATVETHLFWYFAIGLTVGYVSFFVYKDRGVELVPGMVLSTLGSLVVGSLGLILNLPAPAAYAVIGAVGFLFVTNSFRQKDKPVFIDTEQSRSQ